MASFDSACLNHEYRKVFLNKLKDIIFIGDVRIELGLNMIQWLHNRSIYLKSINLAYDDELQSLDVTCCCQLTDASIISLITH